MSTHPYSAPATAEAAGHFLIVVDEMVEMKKESEPDGDTNLLRHVGGIEKELGYKG